MSIRTDDVMTIVDATTPRGEKLTLVTDPQGSYVISTQMYFFGGEELNVAHLLGPGDDLFLKVDATRFSVVSA